jgi:hypothetical protein
MPSTAIISPQIIDSTQIGRDLITAADQAAAQAIIGVTGVDVSADYTWTGDHTFQGSATFDAGVETAAITTATNLVTTLPSGGQGQYYFGLNPIYLMSATEFRPAEALTVATLGSATREWTNVYSVDGNFSGTVTVDQIQNSLGDEGIKFDANYGYLTASNGGANVLRWAGGTFEVYADFNPRYDNTSSLGSDLKRWANVNSIDGSFTGNLINEVGSSYKLYNLGTENDADSEYLGLSWSGNVAKIQALQTGTGAQRRLDIEASGIRFRESGTVVADIDTSALRLYTGSIRPLTNGVASAGTSSIRFSDVFSIDGDFSGTLTTAGLATGVQTITAASDTLVDTDHTNLCDCTSNAITINLPAASAGQQFVIKKIDSSSNAVTIDGFGSETIDGGLTAVINTQYESVTIISDGSNWFIV